MATLFELAAKFQAAQVPEGLLLLAVKATLILAIARLLLFAMPRAAAATKHLVATAALIAVVALPFASASLPSWHVASAKRPTAQAALKERLLAEEERGTAATRGERAASERPAVTVGSAISVAKSFVPDEPLTAVERAISVTQSTWKGWIVVAIGIVAILLLVQMLLGLLAVWHVARHAEELKQDDAMRELDAARDALALDKEVRLLRSARISVPVIWGVFKPVLLLPADVVTWPVERLRVVLLHELAHLKRYDGVSLLLTRIAVSLFWFHPLAWTLERAGRSECERACDDLVLASDVKPSEYADHLLAIARSMPTFDPFRSVTLAMSRKSQLEGRLLSILQPHVVRRVFSGRNIAVACALAVGVIIPVAAVRLTAEPAKEKRVVETAEVKERKVEQKRSVEVKPHETDAEVEVVDHIDAIEDFFLAKLGKFDKRADRFARTPRNGEEWYERGYDYYRNDRYEEAATAFKKAAELEYAEGKALYNAACSYALLGDANRAIPTLREAIASGWDNFDKIAEDSDFDPIRSDPRFVALAKDSVGDVATRREKEAVERFASLQQYGTSSKHHGDDWFEVGLDLLRLRKLDESIAAFEKAIAADENVSAATYNIACAYSLKGDAKNATAWLEKAIENGFSSDDKLAHDPDIAFLRKQPGFAAMAERADELELRGPGHRGNWVNLIFDTKESWDEAAAHHKLIAQKYPQSGRAWFNYGYTALRAEDYAIAIDAFQRAVQLGHRVGTSSYNIGCAYALQGNKDQAFEWLKRAKNAGFDLDDYLDDDDDLHSLRRDARFKALQASVESD